MNNPNDRRPVPPINKKVEQAAKVTENLENKDVRLLGTMLLDINKIQADNKTVMNELNTVLKELKIGTVPNVIQDAISKCLNMNLMLEQKKRLIQHTEGLMTQIRKLEVAIEHHIIAPRNEKHDLEDLKRKLMASQTQIMAFDRSLGVWEQQKDQEISNIISRIRPEVIMRQLMSQTYGARWDDPVFRQKYQWYYNEANKLVHQLVNTITLEYKDIQNFINTTKEFSAIANNINNALEYERTNIRPGD